MKLAMSGTYSTGKTTTTLALSYLVGIPRTHAKTMREILPKALPGKKLEETTGPELLQLGLRRLLERSIAESRLDNFISDGSSLHEWVYGMVRSEIGLHPGSDENINYQHLDELKQYMLNFGAVAKDHAIKSYDEFIHLPIEFPLKKDGHRPVSEEFRSMSDNLLLTTLDELKIPYHIVGGSIVDRLNKIVQIYDFEMKMSIDEAIVKAEQDVEQFQFEIEKTFYKKEG